jgi:hypothetical protein
VQGIAKDSKLMQLQEQFKKLRYTIIAMQETRRAGQHGMALQNGDLLYCYGDTSKNGTGFWINEKYKHHVEQFRYKSDRVSCLELKVDKKVLVVVNAYCPTSSATDQEYEEILEAIQEEVEDAKRRRVMVVVAGDFNARLGMKRNGELCLGNFGAGDRDDRGQILADWLHANSLTDYGSRYKRHARSKWTWRHPNGMNRSTIDYIFGSKPYPRNTGVVCGFSAPSDHRLLRAELPILPHRNQRHRPKKKWISEYHPGILRDSYNALPNPSIDSNPEDYCTELVAKIVTAQDVAGVPRRKLPFLSDRTKSLLERRRILQNSISLPDRIEYVQVSKAARASRKEDMCRRRTERVRKATERQGPLHLKARSKCRFICLSDANGVMRYDQSGMRNVIETFYNNLYQDPDPDNARLPPISEECPEFLQSEVEEAIRKLKLRASSGLDGVSANALRTLLCEAVPHVTTLLNKILRERTMPTILVSATTTLVFKKGDPSDIANYRPITVLPVLYKVLSRCLESRLRMNIESNLEESQCGFRKAYGTTDNIQCITQLIEKAKEYRTPLFACFLDLSKAFDRIRFQSIFECLAKYDVQPTLVHILYVIYKSSKTAALCNDAEIPLKIQRGVRQGDVVSPRLFIAVLNYAISKIDWAGLGRRIQGEMLTHLLYADDAVLFAGNKRHLRKMIELFEEACASVGLELNAKKSVYLNNTSDLTPLKYRGSQLPAASSTIYMGINVSLPMDWNKEISRRISSGWCAYSEYREIFRHRRFPMPLKRRLFESVILPRLIYGSESWALTDKEKDRLRVTQRKMERSMTNIKLTDKIRHDRIRQITKLPDVIKSATLRKLSYAKTIALMAPDRWARVLTEWIPHNRKRNSGSQKKRWVDDIRRHVDDYYKTAARGRNRVRRQPSSQWQQLMRIPDIFKAIKSPIEQS